MSVVVEHEHKWQPNGMIRLDNRVLARSPCSRLDDTLGTVVYSSMVCECGKVRNVKVAHENVRRMGDDLRTRARRVT